MSKPQAPKTGKIVEPIRSAAAAAAATATQTWNAQKQLGAFDAAMKQFHARKFAEAKEQFDLAAQGPERDVAQRARLHITMCDRRTQKPEVQPILASAEDCYNLGVTLINSRKLAEARTHLEKGLQIEPAADHIHFALALAQALSGDLSNAFHHLQRAIELEPRNRLLARQDTDFAPLVNQPPFDSLFHPEKKSW